MARAGLTRTKRITGITGAFMLAATAIAVAVTFVVSGNSLPPGMTPATTTTSTPGGMTGTRAIDFLAALPVKGRAPKTGYDRTEMFGSAWLDVDRNGCDTRNDILQRDLVDRTLEGFCKVLRGTLVDPYTAVTIDFRRGNATSSEVQIDHVVALMNAWETGAQQLTQAEREALANDPINLLAVDGPTNSRKGAGDAATWLPPNTAFRCEYVARQVSVKHAYGLWVTKAERDAMARVLERCPDQPAYSSALPPTE